MSHIVMVVTTVTHRSNSRSIPALVLPFSADHRASGSRSNPLRVRQRTACNYWRLTHSLIFLISSVKSPPWHEKRESSSKASDMKEKESSNEAARAKSTSLLFQKCFHFNIISCANSIISSNETSTAGSPSPIRKGKGSSEIIALYISLALTKRYFTYRINKFLLWCNMVHKVLHYSHILISDERRNQRKTK